MSANGGVIASTVFIIFVIAVTVFIIVVIASTVFITMVTASQRDRGVQTASNDVECLC